MGAGEDEDQRQEPKVDVDVPSRAGFAADVFCVGTAGGICVVCSGICGGRFRGRKLVHAAPLLGTDGRSPGRQPAPDYGCDAAGHLHDRRRGTPAISASGFSGGPLTEFTTFWLRPEHTQNWSSWLLRD